jgi:O-methyltransferase
MPSKLLTKFSRRIRHRVKLKRLLALYKKYQEFTMVPCPQFVANLELCLERAPRAGCIVECGVWRGGMSAAIADVLTDRLHILFDSFEGLPPAKDIDGRAALDYQNDKTSPVYFDNCRAESSFAEKAMKMSAARDFRLVQGWFSETLPRFASPEPIALLRLDADWYESTMDALNSIYPQIMPGGLIIIDDYYAWDGCARAVHDYFSMHKTADRLREFQGICYFTKQISN